MNKQIIREKLALFGLTSAQVGLYLYLLENGAKTALSISREMSINRSKIYRITDELIKKNLIETSNEQWGQTYSAATPESLELLLIKEEEVVAKKRAELNSLIEGLSTLQGVSNGLFDIKFYKGVEGLKQMIWNDLKGKELLVCGAADLNAVVGQTFADKVREESMLRGQKVFELNNRSKHFETTVSQYKEKHFQERTIPKTILPLDNYFEMYNNTIAFTHWEANDVKGVEVHSKSFTETFRQIFWHYWEMGKEVS